MDSVNDSAIASFLAHERLWTAYGLCDLDVPYRRHARFLVARVDAAIVAVVLVYAPPGFSGVLPFGDSAGVAAILDRVRGLPSDPLVLVGEEHLDVLLGRYRVAQPEPMLRLALTPGRFSPDAGGVRTVRLSPADLPQIEALYRTDPDGAFFDPATLSHGIYFGVERETALVAVAGTHAWSRTHRIGAIGGVFTHPAFRGRGLATATTAAVTQALFDAGVDDVVLNVRTDNAPARAAYDRLGFVAVRPYVEGQAQERTTD